MSHEVNKASANQNQAYNHDQSQRPGQGQNQPQRPGQGQGGQQRPGETPRDKNPKEKNR